MVNLLVCRLVVNDNIPVMEYTSGNDYPQSYPLTKRLDNIAVNLYYKSTAGVPLYSLF